MYLSYNQLSGQIPLELGDLSSLLILDLDHNQLTGEIPESICDLNIDWNVEQLSNNQFCPPYPSCNVVSNEYSVGEQDTSNCD